MNIGIIDAEIIGKNKHRFPNLVCMKLSNYFKQQGHFVKLLTNYDDIDNYDKVFISKVFIKTELPFEKEDKTLKTEDGVIEYYKDHPILSKQNVEYGGTGFYYDKSPRLEYNIEHTMPDYHLYDEWVEECIKNGAKEKEFTYYRDYSIGFLTRGCFRQCQFCVNRNYKKCQVHSNIKEFMDESRPKLCFLDDNFLACPNWKEIIKEVKQTEKRFQFKQGLDERLLTSDKIKEISDWKYEGDLIFAFDNIADKDLIISKLNMIYETNPDFNKQMKFYVFCGFDREGKYDEEFWMNDIRNTLLRCKILSKYSAYPYVMRHQNSYTSPYKSVYTLLASWTNQQRIFVYKSFKDYCMCYNNGLEIYNSFNFDDKKDLTEFIPNEYAQYGKWTRHIKEEEKNRKLQELLNINKDKIDYLIENKIWITYKDLCEHLNIPHYAGGTKQQQMNLFNELYEIEKNGKEYLIKGCR